MNRILVIEIEEEHHEAFVKGMPPGKILIDKPVHLRDSEEGQGDATFWFDEKSSSWNKPEFEEYNWIFLRQQQNWANDMLRARGHLFLNEILALLGLPHTANGAVLGWVYDKGGHNFIDFGCWTQPEEPADSERPEAIKLVFNVDGPIFQLIGS